MIFLEKKLQSYFKKGRGAGGGGWRPGAQPKYFFYDKGPTPSTTYPP